MSVCGTFYTKNQRFFVLLGGILLNMSIGSYYSFGIMGPYIIKYMVNHSYDNKSVIENNSHYTFLIAIFGMGSSVTFGDYIASRIGISITVLLAGWFMSITILLMSYTLKSYIVVVMLTYGLLNGIFAGIVYGVTMGAVCSWFLKRNGAIIGILTAAFGLSAFISIYVQKGIMFHSKRKTWEDHFLISYVSLGCIFIILQLIGAILIKKRPQDNLEDLDRRIEQPIILDIIAHGRKNIEMDLKPHHLIFQSNFWILWITYSLLSASIILNIFYSHKFLHRFIPKHSGQMLIILPIGLLLHSIGGFIWGLLIDKYRYKILMLVMTISLAFFNGTFYLAQISKNHKRPEIATVYSISWFLITTFIPSGIFSIFPQVCLKLFGRRNFIANYGMLYTAWSAGALIAGSILLGISMGLEKHTRFLWIFISGSVLSTIAALVTIAYTGKIRKQDIWSILG